MELNSCSLWAVPETWMNQLRKLSEVKISYFIIKDIYLPKDIFLKTHQDNKALLQTYDGSSILSLLECVWFILEWIPLSFLWVFVTLPCSRCTMKRRTGVRISTQEAATQPTSPRGSWLNMEGRVKVCLF